MFNQQVRTPQEERRIRADWNKMLMHEKPVHIIGSFVQVLPLGPGSNAPGVEILDNKGFALANKVIGDWKAVHDDISDSNTFNEVGKAIDYTKGLVVNAKVNGFEVLPENLAELAELEANNNGFTYSASKQQARLSEIANLRGSMNDSKRSISSGSSKSSSNEIVVATGASPTLMPLAAKPDRQARELYELARIHGYYKEDDMNTRLFIKDGEDMEPPF